MKIWAILPAAGVGLRMKNSTPKQYLPLNGKTVIEHSLNVFSTLPVHHITVVVSADDKHWLELEATCQIPNIATVIGGEQRTQSVLNGLRSLDAVSGDWVLVHDAVRPCADPADVKRLIDQVTANPASTGGILAVPIANTVKRATPENDIEATVDRETLWSALTPQLFPYGLLLDALSAAARLDLPVTDEASAMEHAGHSVKLVPGSSHNIKITQPSDLVLAESILKALEGEG